MRDPATSDGAEGVNERARTIDKMASEGQLELGVAAGTALRWAAVDVTTALQAGGIDGVIETQ